MKKKHYDTANIQEDWDILAAHDIQLREMSEYHYRIDGYLDIWPSTRSAYNLRSHMKYEFGGARPFEFVLEATHHQCRAN